MTTLTPAAAPPRSVPKPQGRLGGRWTRFALRRTGRLLVSLWVLVTVSFLMIHLVPGDPVRAALGMTAPTELVEAKRQALGLNDPLLTQYVHYLGNLLHGDLASRSRPSYPSRRRSASGFPPRPPWLSWRFSSPSRSPSRWA